MAEYISREEVLDNAEYTENFNLVVPVRLIKAIPAADVQPIVYCKDCKYAQNPNDTMIYCEYFECGTMGQKDFCSCAEQK